MPPAVNRYWKLELSFKACCFATVWQKYEVKIEIKWVKSRFEMFLVKKRGLVEQKEKSGLKRFLEPLSTYRLAKSIGK